MKHILLLLAVLFSSTFILAQTVTYDTSIPPKPIAITGLDVNGILYDVAIVYNIGVDGTTLSEIPVGETTAARVAIIDAMNAINDESGVNLYTVTNEGVLEWCNNGYWAPSLEWIQLGCGSSTFVANPNQGVAVFTTSIAAVPTLGQWGMISLGLILLIVGTVSIRQKIVPA